MGPGGIPRLPVLSLFRVVRVAKRHQHFNLIEGVCVAVLIGDETLRGLLQCPV